MWEFVCRASGINELLFPPPSVVALTLARDLRTGLILGDAAASLSRVFVGFSAGAIAGVVAGVATGRIKWIAVTLGQILQLLRPIPPLALAPLAVVWLGVGEGAKYTLVAVGAFFPVWLNTHTGVAAVDPHFAWIALSMGASRLQIWWRVYLPGAAHFVLTGLRVGLGISFFCLVGAELAGASAGVVFRIEMSHMVFRIDRMLAGLVVLGLLNVGCDVLLTQAAQQLFPWIADGEDASVR